MLDDYFPLDPNPKKKNEILYASSEEQLWAPLIEKAAAKLHGCYENIRGGSTQDGKTHKILDLLFSVLVKLLTFINSNC